MTRGVISETPMNLKQIEYVLTLAAAGSFAKAADELGISQPSLSQYIKKIEKQLDTVLFDRTGGALRLTDAGRVYADTGRRILALEHEMQGQLNDIAEHRSGSVTVGTSPYRCAAMMPFVAKRFSERYPGMHLIIEEMTTQELLEAAEQGQFDLCLTVRPIDEHIFTCEKIAEEELILAVPSSFPHLPAKEMQGRRYPAVDAALLGGQPFVMITEAQLMQRALDGLAFEHRLSLKKAAVVKSLEAQIAMVRAGVGMALLPSGIEHFCAEGEVRFYSLQQELPKREVVAVWRKDRKLSLAAEELVRCMKEY